MMNKERRKSSTSSKKGRKTSRKSNASQSSVSVTVGTSEELNPEEAKPPERKINYQDELVFIFFSSMLDIVVEEWTPIIPESPSQSENQSADEVITKDYREIKEEDLLVDSQIISVSGQEVSFTRRKMRKRKSSDRSRGSRKDSSLDHKQEKHRKDTKPFDDNKTSPRGSIKRRSLDRKRQKKTSTDVSTTQTGSSVLDIHSEDKSQFGSELSKEISHDSLDWILKSEHEYVRINFRNGNVYEGPVFGKLMHGNGTFYWADGSVYEGEFVNGFITGKGHLIMPDLSYYIGDFYKGMFHGEGVFVISKTPMIYSGQWQGGRKKGKGWLLYEPGNWYDGEWYEDRRHGVGIRRYKSGAIYEGDWYAGHKKGHGTMRWENNDIYRGEWSNDLMHGYGKYIWKAFMNKTLTFPSVNMYAGSWNNGMRDGMGLIRFGVETGSKMAGVWESNLKHGPGVVICGNGQQIELNPLFLCDKPINFYEDDGEESDTCSSCGKESLQMIAEKIKQKRPNKKLDKKIMNNIANNKKFKRGSAKKKRRLSDFNEEDYISCNSVHIPIHAVAEQMDLCYFISIALRKYTEYLDTMPFGSIVFDKSLGKGSSASCLRTISTSKWNILTNTSYEQSSCNPHDQCSYNYSTSKDKHKYASFLQSQIEEKNMRNTLIVYLPKLYKVYHQYATLASSEPINFKVLMPRLFMWQLWIDIGIRKKGVSLIDIDLILSENRSSGLESFHDPFEKLCFWQFVEAIISMSWFYYERDDLKPYLKDGMLPTVFKKFFDEVLEPNAGNFSGHALFEFKNLIPIKSTYLLYRTYGEPHTAREFLCNSCVKKGEEPPCYLKVPEKQIRPYRKGINIVPIGSNTVFLTDEPPDVRERPETPKEEEEERDPYYRTLMAFRKLGPKKIVQCLTTICPNIKEDGVIVNMDYPLSFLEFYEVILLCAFAIADEVRTREERIKYKEEMERLEEIRRLEEEAAAAAEKVAKKTAKVKSSKAKMK